MEGGSEYRFVIDAYSPETLPMARLAEYKANLARLLGRAEQVHFLRIEGGSTALVQRVESEAGPEVRSRIDSLADGSAPDDALRAFRALNRCLADDKTAGSLRDGGGEVVRFPGREQRPPPVFGSFNQAGVLDGRLIRVGGRDDTAALTCCDFDGAKTHLLLHACPCESQ
ncbi:MAG: hypothetical protein F4Y03_12000 [Alphaproteobacteria bacterium]|nr:hypothetical protein [Alphaproteobacteria bacterium]